MKAAEYMVCVAKGDGSPYGTACAQFSGKDALARAQAVAKTYVKSWQVRVTVVKIIRVYDPGPNCK